MSSLAELPELVGFFSYSRDDDSDSNGALSALRDRIQRELRGQLGRSRADFRLWQDKAAIAHGMLWEEEIRSAIAQSVFFIPIITPSTVRSPHCKLEFQLFLQRERALGRKDLIFPIVYIGVPALEEEARWRQDEILSLVGSRQYIDWQSLRHLDVRSTEVAIKTELFCRNICNALRQAWTAPTERQTPEVEAEPPRPQANAKPDRAPLGLRLPVDPSEARAPRPVAPVSIQPAVMTITTADGEALGAPSEPEDALGVGRRREQRPLAAGWLWAALVLGIAIAFAQFEATAPSFGLSALLERLAIPASQSSLIFVPNLVGQLMGAPFFGWVAGRQGRVRAIYFSVALSAAASSLCAVPWNAASFAVCRGVLGFGIGGVLASTTTYLIEFLAARNRGRIILWYQLTILALVKIGMTIAAVAVSTIAWEIPYVIGVVPLLILGLFRRKLPESPLWLFDQGRISGVASEPLREAAGRALDPQASRADAVGRLALGEGVQTRPSGARPGPRLARRVLVAMSVLFAATVANLGLANTFVPTYSRLFHASLSTAVILNTAAQWTGLLGLLVGGIVIDRWGRRPFYAASVAALSAVLLLIATLGVSSANLFAACVTAASFFILPLSVSSFLYVPELFATGSRALVVGLAIAWVRLVDLVAPPAVVALQESSSLYGVLTLLVGVAAILTGLLGIETKDERLDEALP